MNVSGKERTGAVQVFEPEPGQVYSLDTAVYLTGASRRTILVYCRCGLIQPMNEPNHGGFFFDEQAIRRVRQAEVLRIQHGVNLAAVRTIFELTGQLESLREELRFLRGF